MRRRVMPAGRRPAPAERRSRRFAAAEPGCGGGQNRSKRQTDFFSCLSGFRPASRRETQSAETLRGGGGAWMGGAAALGSGIWFLHNRFAAQQLGEAGSGSARSLRRAFAGGGSGWAWLSRARGSRRNLCQKSNSKQHEVISFRSASLEKEFGFLGSRHGDEGNFQRLSSGKLRSKKLAEFGKMGDKQQQHIGGSHISNMILS